MIAQSQRVQTQPPVLQRSTQTQRWTGPKLRHTVGMKAQIPTFNRRHVQRHSCARGYRVFFTALLGAMYPALPKPVLVCGLSALMAAANKARFLVVARSHNLAAELGSPQMGAAYNNGTFPMAKWLSDVESVAMRQLMELRKALKKSTEITVAIVVVVAIALAISGKLDASLPIDGGKVLTAVGALAAGWASILQFHPVPQTFRGNFLHEVAHAAAVRTFFVCGVVLGAIGALWWK